GLKLGPSSVPVADVSYLALTMSPFNPANAPSRSLFSLSPTLNLSRDLTRSSTRALNSPPVTRMCSCAAFILSPLYWHGRPVALQTKSLRLASRRGASVLANFLLMRVSASTLVAKSSTTAEIAAIPPRRSYSDPPRAGAGAAALAAGAGAPPSGGAGLKFAGSAVPVAFDGFSTMSPFNPARAVRDSSSAPAPTLNLSRFLPRFSPSAVTSPAVVPIFLCDVFISRPVYRHGPPVA